MAKKGKVLALAGAVLAISAIEKEILDVTGAKPRSRKESDQEYRARMAKAVDSWTKRDNATSEEADERYDSLSEATQEWVAAAATAINEKKDIPKFPHSKAASAEEPNPAPDSGEKEKVVKKKKGDGATKPSKPKPAKKADRKPRPRGGRHAVFRKQVIESHIRTDGKARFAEVYDAYEKKAGDEAITRPSASVVFSNTVATLMAADEMGHLKR